MNINPLLFCPSPRDIPEVIESWEKLPYDKFIVKKKLEKRAYQEGRDFFLNHPEYTHLVICPDDLIIDYESFMILKKDIEEGYSNIAGISNIDETQPDVYCCKYMGADLYSNGTGLFYTKQTIPKEIFEAGFTGFTCQWIERKLVERLSFRGGCNNEEGCMDTRFTQELQSFKIKQYVEPRAKFYHMRFAQYDQVRAWKNGSHKPDEGYSVLLKKGDRYNPKIALCCSFYNDVENIKRLMNTVNGLVCIFVDGRWINYEGDKPLSTDGSREYLKQHPNVILIDAPDLIEYQKRNEYIKKAQELGFDYCFVIDSDEFIIEYDYDKILKSLRLGHDAYSHIQEYDQTSHPPYYRIHRTNARHEKKHQEIWIDDNQIFTPNNIVLEGFVTRHDKSLREVKREVYNKEYYKNNPIR